MEEITLEKASEETYAWQASNKILAAFLIRKNDIECVLNEEAATSVRFYMGIKEIDTPDMLVVGVDKNNNDIIDKSLEATSHVYDFAVPCPRLCDEKSPLLNTSIPKRSLQYSTNINFESVLRSTCEEALTSIPFPEAMVRTKRWQDVSPLKSIVFTIDELQTVYNSYEVESIRVYFGLATSGMHTVIMIGVNSEGRDISRAILFKNSTAPCTTTHKDSCAVGSPLCHDCYTL